MKRFQDRCTISSEAFSTAHWKTVTEYGAEYFQGLDERSNSAVSNLLGGMEEVIAFRPVEVMAVGLEAEKRGRMMVWRRYVTMNEGVWICCVWVERMVLESEMVRGVVHGSRGRMWAMRERSICRSRAGGGSELLR